MSKPLKLLVIEDDPADFLLLERHLRQHGIDAACRRVADDGALAAALTESWDAVLADYGVPGMPFRASLGRIRAARPALPVLLVSGSIGEEAAVDLLRQGVADFVLKGNLARLEPAIERAVAAAAEHAAWLAAEERLRLMAAVFNATQEGVAITDADGNVLSVNQAFTTITEYAENDVLGHKLSLLQSGRHEPAFYQAMWRGLTEAGYWQGEIWNRRKGGEIYPQWLTISTVTNADGAPEKFVAVFTDISRINHATTHLEHLAHHDALTDLPNRLMLDSRFEHSIERARRDGKEGAVLFLDLDRFKAVNDTLGHRAGDGLLQQVARRIKGRLREVDTLARLGGDEFVVVLDDATRAQAAEVARTLIDLLAEPFVLEGGRRAEIGCSIGICLFPCDGDTVAGLLARADAALYAVKHAGRNGFRFHDEVT